MARVASEAPERITRAPQDPSTFEVIAMHEKILSFDLKHTAIHEAGHAVAHQRLNILQDKCTIVASDTRAGAVTAEGTEHVWSMEEAHDQVVAYCAGYAALVAAGVDEGTARLGADDDFDQATHLIEFWGLEGDLDTWCRKAKEFMGQPENLAAVQRVADELLRVETLDFDDIAILVDITDGLATEDDYARFKAFREMPCRS
jgi:ATP-dependent Zn protease